MQATVSRFGGIDVLVNNAGVAWAGAFAEEDYDSIGAVIDVNVKGVMYMARAVLPHMIRKGEGVIINVSSGAGLSGCALLVSYCASKFALTGFTESLFMDLHDTPLRIRLVIPGPFDTDIWDRPGSDPAAFKDEPKLPPEDCATGIIDAITGDDFEHYVPDMKGVVEFKTSNIEQFLAGVASRAPTS